MQGPLSRLAHLITAAQASGQYIRKSKIYLKPGMKPPANVRVYDGKRSGRYYLSEEVTGTPKRLPAFRKHEDGSLRHPVRSGPHGEGHYQITHHDGKYHLHFHGLDGKVHALGTATGEPLAALNELKSTVRDIKTGKGRVAESTPGYSAGKPAGARQKSKTTHRMPINLQIRKIKEDLARDGQDVEAIDVQALVDSTLSFEENRRLVLGQLNVKTKKDEKRTKDTKEISHDFCMQTQEQCEISQDRDACLAYVAEGCHKRYGPVDIPLAIDKIHGEDHTDITELVKNKSLPFSEAYRWFRMQQDRELVGIDKDGQEIEPGSSTVPASYHLKGAFTREEVEEMQSAAAGSDRYEETKPTAIKPFHQTKNPRWTSHADGSLSIKRFSPVDASPFDTKPVRSVLDSEYKVVPQEGGAMLMYRKAGTQDWMMLSHATGPNAILNIRHLKTDASHLSENPVEIAMRAENPQAFSSLPVAKPVKELKVRPEKKPVVSARDRKRQQEWADLITPASASRGYDFVADYLVFVTKDETHRKEQADGRQITRRKGGGYTMTYPNGATIHFTNGSFLYEYLRRTSPALGRLCRQAIDLQDDILVLKPESDSVLVNASPVSSRQEPIVSGDVGSTPDYARRKVVQKHPRKTRQSPFGQAKIDEFTSGPVWGSLVDIIRNHLNPATAFG